MAKITSKKGGISAMELKQQVGFGQTAWGWLHKIRRERVRPDRQTLSGRVEFTKGGVRFRMSKWQRSWDRGFLGRGNVLELSMAAENEAMHHATIEITPEEARAIHQWLGQQLCELD